MTKARAGDHTTKQSPLMYMYSFAMRVVMGQSNAISDVVYVLEDRGTQISIHALSGGVIKKVITFGGSYRLLKNTLHTNAVCMRRGASLC